ncbi:MAG: riboflavin synthase [Myxococcales bacterium]|nr:riboflavin synthase [Myxococcales bacterium]MCB9733903.1 riboflavin synthase [Deltaproteobacteria bacterium]
MFTGIIEDVGTLAARVVRPDGARMAFATRLPLGGVAIGASIAVNGACLTVVERDGDRFWTDVSKETLARTNLGALAVGDPVNLENALTLSARLDGHIVQGHVDGVGRLAASRRVGDGWELDYDVPEALLPTVVEKGSITLDGVSLTVARLADPRVTIAVVPHTATMTTLTRRPVGAPVNVETDILGKYVQRMLSFGKGGAGGGGRGLSLADLAENGFL